MASLLDTLMGQLGGDPLRQMSRTLGTDEKTTQGAAGAALSTLIGGLARGASDQGGAQSLHAALAKDHDGLLVERGRALAGEGDHGVPQGLEALRQGQPADLG